MIWTYVLGQKYLALAAVMSLVTSSLVTLAFFSNVGWFTDRFFGNSSSDVIDDTLMTFLLSLFAVATLAGVRFVLVSAFGERVTKDLRQDLFKRVVQFEYAFFEAHKPGALATSLIGNVAILQQALGSTVSVVARNAIMLLGGVGLLVVRSPFMLLAIVVVALIAIVPLHLWGARVREASAVAQAAIGEATSRFTETVLGIETVKLFGQEDEERDRFARTLRTVETATGRQIMYRGLLNFLLTVLLVGAVAVVLWLGARQVTAGLLTSADFASSVGLFVVVASSIAALGDMFGEYQKVRGALDQIAPLMSRPINPRSQHPGTHEHKGKLGVSFRNVCFSYPSRPDDLSTDNFSLDIQPGERVAIVGASGAGKSTILKLLQGLYTPSAGEIWIGDRWNSRTSMYSPAGFLTVVPQDVMIFADTAFANISFARAGSTLDQVRQAARAAYADEFISELPHGYDTQLGPRGVRLSGGQRQRIAIARAALRDSPLLLLDEATSALDSGSEKIVLDAMAALMEESTSIVIAHRLSTLAGADRIVVIHDGRSIDQGRHGELLARCDVYRRLVELQLHL